MGSSKHPRVPRLLVRNRQYFGLAPFRLLEGAARVAARAAGLPTDRTRVTARQLQQDFGVATVEARPLVGALAAEGLLKPYTESPDVYRIAPQFADFAAARVFDPLPRDKARKLLDDACAIAAHINTSWARVPLEIEAIAPFGAYMTRESELSEISFAVVVRLRPLPRRAPWRMLTKADGANAIKATFRKLSPLIQVRLVTTLADVPRPFAVAFRAD
jgi:hypothetical protein